MSVLLKRAALSVLGLSACLLMFAAACADSDTEEPSATASWQTYTDPDGRYSLRYPSDWYSSESGGLYSYDVNSDTGPSGPIRPNEMKIDVSILPAPGRSGCGGALSLDASGEVDSIDPQATETTLGGQPAWEIVRDDPEDGLTLIRAISLIHEGYCIHLATYSRQEIPDEQTFEEIADSFEISF